MTTATCRSCRAPSTLEEWFDSATVSWPQQRWLLVTCPRCHERQHLRVASGSVQLGTLDGAPGPVFVADGGMAADERIVIKAARGHVRVALGRRRWRVVAKR